MLNYPFVYPERQGERPGRLQADRGGALSGGRRGHAQPPRRSAASTSASARSPTTRTSPSTRSSAWSQPENQITAATLGGLPPTNEAVYETKEIEEAYPGFSDLIKESIDNAAPRPMTPAYTDLSLAIQRSLHPVGDIDPADVAATYDELVEKVEQAVKREGLL